MSPETQDSGRVWRIPRYGVVAVLCGALVWAAFLGWDNTYYQVAPEFPGDSGLRGPYMTWQVALCVIFLVFTAASFAWVMTRQAAAVTVSLGFWFCWTTAAAVQGDGLFIIGSGMLALGLYVGTLVAASLGIIVQRRIKHL